MIINKDATGTKFERVDTQRDPNVKYMDTVPHIVMDDDDSFLEIELPDGPVLLISRFADQCSIMVYRSRDANPAVTFMLNANLTGGNAL